MLLIVVSPHHSSPTPLRMSLGRHMLMIIRESNQAFAFESVSDTEGIPTEAPALFNNEEAYKLCMCLHVLFQPGPSQRGNRLDKALPQKDGSYDTTN